MSDIVAWIEACKLPQATLVSILSTALTTRTYLAAYRLTEADGAVFNVLRDVNRATLPPTVVRWLALCTELIGDVADCGSLSSRLSAMEKQAACLQTNFDTSASCASVARVASALRECAGSALWRVPDDYYSYSLDKRASLLRCDPAFLCKTLIFDIVGEPPRRVAVLVQYIARIDANKLSKLVGAPVLLSANGAELAGFEHNGVSPVGALISLPLIVAEAVMGLPFVWAGGGAPNVKARLFRGPLRRLAASVWDVSVPRGDEAE